MSGKKYFWLKLRRDFFKRHDIRILKAMDNGEAITLGQKYALKYMDRIHFANVAYRIV